MTTITPLYVPGRLWNIKDRNIPDDAISIGPGTPWATPFTSGRDGTREDIITQYDKWVLHAPDRRARWIRDHISDLAGYDMVCSCPRGYCHGRVLTTLAHLETCNPTYQPGPRPTDGIWLRVSATEHGRLQRFRVKVSETGPAGRVIDADDKVRWMIGNSCVRIGDWIRRREGSVSRLDQIHTMVMPTLEQKVAS